MNWWIRSRRGNRESEEAKRLRLARERREEAEKAQKQAAHAAMTRRQQGRSLNGRNLHSRTINEQIPRTRLTASQRKARRVMRGGLRKRASGGFKKMSRRTSGRAS